MNSETLLIAGVAMAIVRNVLMSLVFLTCQTHKGFGYWVMATFCRSAALVLFWPLMQSGHEFLVLVVNYLLIVSVILDRRGVVIFRDGHPGYRLDIAVSVGFIALQAWFTYSVPDIVLRTFVYSVFVSFLQLSIVFVTLRKRPAYFGYGDRLMVLTFALLAVLNMFRGLDALDINFPLIGDVSGVAVLNLTFLVSVAASVLIDMSQVIMNAQRLEFDLRRVKKALELDIENRQRTEAELVRSEAKFHTLFETSSEASMIIGGESSGGSGGSGGRGGGAGSTGDRGAVAPRAGAGIDCNAAALKMFGLADKEEFVATPFEVLSPRLQPDGTESASLIRRHRAEAFSKGNSRFEWTHCRKDTGQEFPCEVVFSAIKLDGKDVLLTTVRDFTERKQYEQRIQELADFDALTGLPNRRVFSDRLAMAQLAGQRSGCWGAVLFLDLDNFKPLNDRHGHVVGDLLLIEVGKRLTHCLREIDTVARFGGDEFVVMLVELNPDRAPALEQAGRVAEKIRVELSAPYFLQSPEAESGDALIEHHCTSSIGVTLFLGPTPGALDIMKQADGAMYEAKSQGRNLVRFH